MISESGHGALIYMRQEGRGIGLLNKLKAYALQDQGLDTVQANEALGFKADLREYELASQILHDLNLTKVELLTSNPKKVNGLIENNIKVIKRSDMDVGRQAENISYLKTKKEKMGHLFV